MLAVFMKEQAGGRSTSLRPKDRKLRDLGLSEYAIRGAITVLQARGELVCSTYGRSARYRYNTPKMREERQQNASEQSRAIIAYKRLVDLGYDAWREGNSNVGISLASVEALVKLAEEAGKRGPWTPGSDDEDDD